MGISIKDHLSRYAIVAGVGAVDQASKYWALEQLFYPPAVIDLLPFLRFVPVWNEGVSFGLLGGYGMVGQVLLASLALLAAAGLPLVARHWEKLARHGMLLIAGGALGNGIDRIIHGKVVDFIDVFAGQWHWPAFNIADMSICVGAGLVFFSSFREYFKG